MVLIMPEGLQVLYETHMDCLVLLSGLLFQEDPFRNRLIILDINMLAAVAGP